MKGVEVVAQDGEVVAIIVYQGYLVVAVILFPLGILAFSPFCIDAENSKHGIVGRVLMLKGKAGIATFRVAGHIRRGSGHQFVLFGAEGRLGNGGSIVKGKRVCVFSGFPVVGCHRAARVFVDQNIAFNAQVFT